MSNYHQAGRSFDFGPDRDSQAGRRLTLALREGITIASSFQEAARHLQPLREWGARSRIHSARTIVDGRRRHGAVKHARDELRRLRREMR